MNGLPLSEYIVGSTDGGLHDERSHTEVRLGCGFLQAAFRYSVHPELQTVIIRRRHVLRWQYDLARQVKQAKPTVETTLGQHDIDAGGAVPLSRLGARCVTAPAPEFDMSATALDRAIWRFQQGRR